MHTAPSHYRLLGPVVGAPVPGWQQMVQVNVLGLLYCAHAAFPHLLRAAEDRPRHVADFKGRPRRLQLFLAEYGWTGPTSAFLDVVAARIQAHVTSLRDLAAHDPLFARIVTQGGADALEAALAELAHFT